MKNSNPIVKPVMELYTKNPWVWEAVNRNRVINETNSLLSLFDMLQVGIDVLDLGCGTGHHANLLNDHNYNVIGLDSKERVIALAKQLHKDVDFLVGDMRKLKYKAKFDAVICMQSVFSYNHTLVDIISALFGINAALKEFGVIVIDVIDIFSLLVQKRFDEKRQFTFQENGKIVNLTTTHTLDMKKQTMTTCREWRLQGDNTLYVDTSVARLFFPQELIDMLSLSGFKIVESILLPTSNKDRLLVVGKKKNSPFIDQQFLFSH